MSPFRAAVLAIPLIVSGCISTGNKSTKTGGQEVWTDVHLSANKNRKPTSTVDYLAEIDAVKASWIGSKVADPEVLIAKKRMEKIFEFARANPHAFFGQLRAQRPILSSPGGKGKALGKAVDIPAIFLVTKYRDVKEILDQSAIFTVKPYARIMDATVGSPYMLGRDHTSANAEKPTMLHALNGKDGDNDRVRAIVKHLAQEAIRNGAKDGQIDVVKSVTRAVPLGINEEYFGFNGPSREASARWSRATQHAFFHNPFRDEDVNAASIQAGKEMRAYISSTLVPQRRQELANGRPANDTVSQVLNLSHIHGQFGLSDERIVANIIGLLVGSVETTSAAIAQSLQFLMNNPGIMARAQQAAREGNDELLSKFVWEALRFDMVNPWLGRYAEEDYVLGRGTSYETKIPKGSLILASTESAMWDEDVFPQSSSFVVHRDQKKFMHLGYGSHTCLGNDVSLVMVPETIKQILLLPNIRRTAKLGQISQDKGPFPESYVLEFDQDFAAAPGAASKLSTAINGLKLEAVVGKGVATHPQRKQVLNALGALTSEGPKKQQAIQALPAMVATVINSYSEQDRIDACAEINPKSKEVFPDRTDRYNYCAVNAGFRSCYFIQRLIAGQSGFSSYYHCAYGQNLLNSSERDLFKKQMGHLDQFYYLNLEKEGGR